MKSILGMFVRVVPGVVLLSLLAGPSLPAAQANDNAPQDGSMLYLRSGVVDPVRAPQESSRGVGSQSSLGSGTPAVESFDHHYAYLVVQFNGPVEEAWTQQIKALGGEVLDYIPDNAHIVRVALTSSNPAALSAERFRALPGVRWVGDYLPEYKFTADAKQRIAASARSKTASGAEQMLDVYVGVFTGESATDLERVFAGLSVTVQAAALSPWGDVYKLSMQPDAIAALAAQPAVNWVEPVIEMTLSNDKARRIMGVEKVWQDLGYYGAGQIIAVSDSGLSVQGSLSKDFDGRLVKAFAPSEMNVQASCKSKTNWTDLNGHGTHVAGSVLGNGTLSGGVAANHAYGSSFAGAAPEATLVFMALNTDGSGSLQCVDPNGDFLAKGYQNGARISSNSWGGNDRGAYSFLASLVDNYVWQNKDYLVFFAAGNAGPGAQTVGSPATGKNVFTVGATENDRPDRGARGDDPNSVADFSSRGPTADGRVKPEVTAPGTWILSARAAQAPDGSFWATYDANYAFSGGTSMATPLTAGSAALVREWLAKHKGQTNPSAALMKAVMINGAFKLPNATTPDLNSGFGRVDIKNTLGANYAVLDDNVQGLQTGQSVSYTVQVIGANALGTVLSIPNDSPGPITATAQMQSQLASEMPPMTLSQAANASADAAPLLAPSNVFTGEALPGYGQAARLGDAIPSGTSKSPVQAQAMAVQPGAVPSQTLPLLREKAPAAGATSPRMLPRADATQETQSFLYNFVGGGNFEDPAWTQTWQYVWLGAGVPLRTSDPSLVINGNYSMWLGGTPSDDALFYPITFPDPIDTSQQSYLRFKLTIYDQDTGYDKFCVALIDASANFIGPYMTSGPDCADTNGNYTYSLNLSAQDLALLAGQTGYLALFTFGDGQVPHTSALIDDVALALDLPNPTATSTPSSGPAGTKFLVTGKYAVPYGSVDVCLQPCSTAANYITTVYADARGSVAAFLKTSTTATPGVYALQTRDVAGRLADTSFTVAGGVSITLAVAPPTGTQGTTFAFNGEGFVPNDTTVAVKVNGQSFGTVGSNVQGQVAFTLNTQSNTPPGSYTVQVTDRTGRSASATFAVTALDSGQPKVIVWPASGAPGASFVFTATGYTPGVAATVTLDGQVLGQVNINSSGSAVLTLQTKDTIPPARYTLSIAQGPKQASAEFEITGGGGGGTPTPPASGNGVYVTLVWTDPPAQASATKTLVNDLDLTVSGPGGVNLLGNGGASADRKNNVEAIRLENPAAGTYVVTVRAQAVNATYGAQPFALVATTRQNFGSNGSNQGLVPPSGSQRPVYLPLIQK